MDSLHAEELRGSSEGHEGNREPMELVDHAFYLRPYESEDYP
ncbi:hypothetical protein VTO73DRAFT_10156 [Trametes versicolor]